MTIETDIDELLRQDEAELKAKRKRLKDFGTSLDEARRILGRVRSSAEGVIAAGDLTRADLGRVFKLTSTERAAILPPRKSQPTEGAEPDEATTGESFGNNE